MSDFSIDIFDYNQIVEIEVSTEDNTENLEITSSVIDTVEISTGFAATIVYASDIVGLDNYLANFIDNYEIDCGTP